PSLRPAETDLHAQRRLAERQQEFVGLPGHDVASHHVPEDALERLRAYIGVGAADTHGALRYLFAHAPQVVYRADDVAHERLLGLERGIEAPHGVVEDNPPGFEPVLHIADTELRPWLLGAVLGRRTEARGHTRQVTMALLDIIKSEIECRLRQTQPDRQDTQRATALRLAGSVRHLALCFDSVAQDIQR